MTGCSQRHGSVFEVCNLSSNHVAVDLLGIITLPPLADFGVGLEVQVL